MSDPNNKWNQPATAPAPMFFGKKERDLVKQVNDELAERVIGQPIAYYPISIEESNFSEIYGEAIDKISLPPVRVYAYVIVENEQTNDRYGYEYQTKLTVNFNRKRLVDDQNLFVRVGDFVQYGDQFYEIVKTYNDTRYYFGQVQHKFQISAECIRARTDAFRVIPGIDRTPETSLDGGESSSPAPRPAPYPPLDASYVVMGIDSRLPSERVLTAGTGITILDGGANGPVTIASTAQNAVGPTGSIQFQEGAGAFSGSASLVYDDTTLRITGSFTASAEISASAYFGDGSNLTGVGGTPGGLTTEIQFNNGGDFAGSADLTFDGSTLSASALNVGPAGVDVLTVIGAGITAYQPLSGTLVSATTLSASLMNLAPTSGTLAGGGSYLGLDVNNNVILSAGDGATTPPASPANSIQFNDASAFGGSANLTYDSSTNFVVLSGTMAISSSGDQALFRVDAATGGNVLFATGSGRVGVNTAAPNATLEVVGTTGDPSPAFRISGTGPKLQFDENDAGAGRFQIQASNGMLKWQVQNSDFDSANVKWMMNSDGYMAFRNGAAAKPIPARVYISGSGDSNLLQVSSSAASNILVVTGSGRVGIGTDTPTSTLHVVGDVTASVGLSGSLVQVTTLSASLMNLAPTSGSLAGPGSYLGLDVNNNLVLSAGDGATTPPASPTNSIQFNDASAFGGSANLTYDGTNVLLTGSISSSATISGALGQYTTLSASGGRITGDFHIDGTVGGAVASPTDGRLVFDNQYDSGGDTTANKIVLYESVGFAKYGIGISSGDFDFFAGAGANYRFYNEHVSEVSPGTEVLTIKGGGNLGVGETNPTRKLEVAGDIYGSGSVQINEPHVSTIIGTPPMARLIGNTGSSQTPETILRLSRKGVSTEYYPAVADFNVSAYDVSGSPYGPYTQLDIALKDSASWLESGSATIMSLRDNGNVGIGTRSPAHTLTTAGNTHLSGGLVHMRTAVTAATYTLQLSDYYVGVDSTANPVTLTVPAASTAAEGQTFAVKDEGGQAATNNITISRSASDTIDGDISILIESPYGSVMLYTDGANWFIY